jgi:hypothetical protein
VLYNGEHNESEEDSDKAVADDGGGNDWTKTLEDGFVESQAYLVAKIGDAGRS